VDQASSKLDKSNSKPGKSNSKGRAGRWIKRGLAALFVIALLVATVFALLPKPVPVEVEVLGRGPMEVSVDEDGKTRVIDRYVVSAPLVGTMGRITLEPGDRVEQGGLIATIEATEPPLLDARTRAEAEARLRAAQAAKRQAQAALERAKAAAEFAASERDRIAKLVGKGSYASRNLDVADLDLKTRKQELASTRFGVRVAQYELEMARATIRRIERQEAKQGKKGADRGSDEAAGPVVHVHSPIEGTVLRVLQEQEGVVAPGTALIELADSDALELVADVLTTDAVHIERGDVVHIRQWGGEQALEGRVRLVEPSAFTKISALGVEEQRVNVIIDLLAKPDGLELGDGYRVEVSIVVWASDDVLLLPVSALFRADDRWAVWIVEEGVAHRRALEIGRRQGLWVEARAGVEAGEQVIVHPSDAVTEGVEVEVEDGSLIARE
jgi:HlyD family secretion protein